MINKGLEIENAASIFGLPLGFAALLAKKSTPTEEGEAC